MSVMDPFFAHVEDCKICQAHPHTPCSRGAALLKDGTERLTRKMIGDPNRAKA